MLNITTKIIAGTGLMLLGTAVPSAFAQKLLLSEFAVTRTAAEYFEIYNPGASAVDLTDVYIADYKDYYNITTGGVPGATSDFWCQFPAGTSIAPGQAITVSPKSATDFHTGDGTFLGYGIYPDYDFDAADANAPAMLGSYGGSSGLSNGDEMLVLFTWDGVSDLVQDLDYVVWGNTSDAMDKTGIAVGTSTYLADTAVALQEVTSAPWGGNTTERIDPLEGTQVQTGGNGISGGDETSENLTATWMLNTSPNPGTVNFGSPGVGTPFCYGDVNCPCGNNSAPASGEGCLNGTGFGALITGSGNPTVGNDTLILTVSQATPNDFGIFVQNIGTVAPAPFYNGLICLPADSHLVRHYAPPAVQPTVCDATGTGTNAQGMTVGDFIGDTAPGVTVNYQFWYRDNTGACGTGANFSAGLSVAWI